ncbi:BppU family phage baseplate upper protein [Clostridium perfringens]|nr:BppU family phage baseplate upper protein [Clostridium perfringens]
MAKKPIRFTLDTIDSNYSPVGTVKQLDSVFFYIKVTENGVTKDLTGQTIKLFAVKEDKKLVEQITKINIANPTEGTVEIELLNAAIQVPGFTYFELEISDDTGIISTSDFILRVNRKVGSDEAIESTNEVATLKEIEIYVAQAKVELQKFKELQAAMLKTNENINAQESLRKNAETERINAEEERSLKESERIEAETSRIEEEDARTKAETSRVNAESNRTIAEKERVKAEELRKDAETSRATEERRRVTEEGSRVEAESSRVTEETKRVTAETERIEAENARATAEEGRTLAEQNREENFKQFEDKINEVVSDTSQNKIEIEEARTATTGEVFDSIDKRIDAEVGRLNKKIEVSMLEQEDAESHVVENSIDGMTTDMIVKGRTLVNISPTGVANCNNVNDFNHNYQEVQVIQGDGFIQCTQPSTGKYNILGYDSSMLKPLTNYIHIADVEIVSNESNEDCRFHFGYMDKKKEVFINSGRGIISVVAKTKESVIGGNKSWIGIMLGTDSSISKNRSFKVYNIASYEIAEEEASKEINELLLKYPVKNEGTKSFGQEEDKISILSSGKNIFKGYNQKIKLEKGKTYAVSSATSAGAERLYIKNVKEGDITPTLFYWNTSSGQYNLGSDKDKLEGVTIKCNNDCEAIFAFSTAEYIDMQIEEGTVATSYQPYQQDKKDILLSSYGFDEGLRGINSVTDELNSIRNVVIKRINKYINSNNETISIHTIRNNTISFNYSFIKGTPKGKNSNPNVITNCFVTNTLCYANDVEGCFGTPNGFFGSISKTKLETNDIEGIKKYIQENFKECYYELAEPVEVALDTEMNTKVFGSKTYIDFENSIKGTSSFKAPVDTAATITILNRENKVLEEENLNLRQDLESTAVTLENSDLELIKQNVDLDFRVMEIEFALDVPINLSNQNIKFINKKGEIKSMARTPYEMMKIVILSGDYDREDYMKKAKTYYDRGRMTKEEYDELVSLMTADEVINK